VDIRVLGPFEVRAGDRVLPLGGPQVRAVLALLVAAAGRVVSVDALVDGLWGPHAPADAARTVRTYVSRLRKVLPGEAILTRPPGYLLRLPADSLDAARFEALVAAGRQALAAGQPAVAAGQLIAAAELWRGEAYGEFDEVPALLGESNRLARLRDTAVEGRIEAALAAGQGGELIAELAALTARHPDNERLCGHLMTALYRAGRQADALEEFRRIREVLVDASGLEPSRALAEIHRQVLAQDPGLLAAVPAAAVPAQLPPAVAAFAGREQELAELDALLPERTAVVISALAGTAGIGKTALAVHWAHRVAPHFPDGQLYVNLRGFDPGGTAVDPAEAVRGFLDALGVPVERIPAGLDARTGLYRSLLTGRRMLVLLDNARDAEQVRPLLPGAAGCLVVVTSRNHLTPLVVTDGARPLTLDLLTDDEATDLLARRLGADRVAAEPWAVTEIIARGARLPLALAVVAARAAGDPGRPLAALVAELRADGGGLDAFDAGDAATDVRRVLSWSYRALSEDAARVFRLLAVHPGPDVSVAAAASLAGLPVPRVRRLLTELAHAHLITGHTPGRYTFHDLLRAYATELAAADDDGGAALRRTLDHYLHTADTAAALLHPHRDPVALAPPAPGVTPEALGHRDVAFAWFAAEQAVLLAALTAAVDGGFDAHTWQLPRSMINFLDAQGKWQDIATTQRAALAAATRLADCAAQARIHRLLARAAARLGRTDEARTHLGHALELYAELADVTGQAHGEYALMRLWAEQGDYETALPHAKRALELYREVGHQVGQAHALNAIGWCHAQLGDHREALVHCSEALILQRELADRAGEADILDSIGYAHHHLGHHDQAAASYRQALMLHRRHGDRYHEAETLTHLGDTQGAAGDRTAARASWRDALTILDDLGHADAAAVRARFRQPAKELVACG
jgi:DNA-binding SARP family transcriptional activator/tetratricopeptide (TPR) repeat protein